MVAMAKMTRSIPLVAAVLLGLVSAQTPDGTPEVHPKITTWQCTKKGGCVKQTNKIVLDSLYHPIYQENAPEYDCGVWGETPNATACPDIESCQAECKQRGISDYSEFGIQTDGDALLLEQLGEDGSLLTPRVYLLKEDGQEYEMLKLTGGEFSFDVDVSKLPCGMNGALYLSEMAADGGKSELNKGGAYHGTGYCDAQCYTTPFINGEPNLEGYGSCCNEMDIWEANARSNTFVPHPCNVSGLVECEGEACEWGGICDKWGCGWNPYQLGNTDYYGQSSDFTVDTTRPFTVVSQFPADENGKLLQYRRFYIQDGKKIPQAEYNLEEHADELGGTNWIDDNFCEVRNSERYNDLGAAGAMGGAMARGMVLALSIWWDAGGNMTWLDGATAGSGPCRDGEGNPTFIEEVQPDTAVIFSKIKWGELDSTYKLGCKSRARKG